MKNQTNDSKTDKKIKKIKNNYVAKLVKNKGFKICYIIEKRKENIFGQLVRN